MNILISFIKVIWIYSWACLLTCVLFIPITLAALFSSTGKLAFTISKFWAWVMLKVTNVKVVITGQDKIDPEQSYIIIANHQSLYDIVSLVTILNVQFRWIIKKEVYKVPLFGYALYKSRNIFIDRSNRDQAIQSMKEGLDRLPPGVSVMCFAEGTRSPDGKLQEFKTGGFVLALENGFPILPVTINGSAKILSKKGRVFNPGTIQIIVNDPIDTRKYDRQNLKELIANTRDVIQTSLNHHYPDV